MKISQYFRSSTIVKIVLILWIVSSVFILFLLRQIDQIVYGDLYNYGLQFSYEWAVPYWTNYRLIMIFLLVPVALSAVTLFADLLAWLRGERIEVTVKKREPATAIKKVSDKKVERHKGKKKETREGAMLIACSKCGKTFARPLLMLDFSGGKTKLINVCPYCGAKLGENDKAEVGEFYVKEPEEKRVYENE